MFIKLLICFTFIPILELYVLIEAGRMIGLAQTILLIFLTGVAGAWLARSQGLEIVRKIQEDTQRGEMPAATLLDGALVLTGGLLLLTPGFCTDLFGFSLIAPFSRPLWRQFLAAWLQKQIQQGTIKIHRI